MISQDEKTAQTYVPNKTSVMNSGSCFVAILTLAKVTLGAGILGLPQKTYYAGIPIFLVLLAISAYFTIKSIEYICQASYRTKKYVFEEITEALCGRGMGIFLGVAMLLNCYGASIVYVVAIRDSFKAMLVEVQASSDTDWALYATMIVGAVVLVPLSTFEKINSIRLLTLGGVIGVIFMVASIIYAFIIEGVSPTFSEDASKYDGAASVVFKPMGGFVEMMTVISTLTFAFCNQSNVPQIYEEMHDKRPQAVAGVAVWSTVLAMVLYILAAIFGYLCYGFGIQNDIMSNFAPLIARKNVFMYLGTSAVIVSVALGHLLNSYPITLSILYFLPKRFENNKWIKWGIPPLSATATIGFGLWYSNLSFFLGFVGAISGSVICYIVPGLFSLRLVQIKQQEQLQASVQFSADNSLNTTMTEDTSDMHCKSAVGSRPWYVALYKNPVEYSMVFVGIVVGLVGTFCEIYNAVTE